MKIESFRDRLSMQPVWLRSVVKINVGQSLLFCLAFYSQGAAQNLERGSHFVNCLLQDDSQLQRLADRGGDSIHGDFAPGLFL